MLVTIVIKITKESCTQKHIKKHDEEFVENDPLVSDITEACEKTPMILM